MTQNNDPSYIVESVRQALQQINNPTPVNEEYKPGVDPKLDKLFKSLSPFGRLERFYVDSLRGSPPMVEVTFIRDTFSVAETKKLLGISGCVEIGGDIRDYDIPCMRAKFDYKKI